MKQYFESESDSLSATQRHFFESLRWPLVLIGLIWLIHLWQIVGNWDAAEFGIVSRRAYGLRGIVTGPLGVVLTGVSIVWARAEGQLAGERAAARRTADRA